MNHSATPPRPDEADCVATLSPCPPAAGLGQEWQELEARSTGSAFLAWPWIDATGISRKPGSVLARVTHGGRTVGLGLLGLSDHSSVTLGPRTLSLNETGDPIRDRIMIEYNGVLAERGWEARAADALLVALGGSTAMGEMDLNLSGVPRHWIGLCRSHGLATRLLRLPQTAPCAALQINPGQDFLDSLTRNSRQQIRRSLRHYMGRAALTLDRAADAAQALDWLDGLEALHTRSWRQRGKDGAFADPSFKEFHRRLITTSFDQGMTDVLRLRCGDMILGYLYNLRWRDVVSAYQSGFLFEDSPQARPGLVAHVMAMNLYRGEAMTSYRFLAGQARYKTSLATDKDELLWMVAYRPSLGRWLGVTAGRCLRSLRSCLAGSR